MHKYLLVLHVISTIQRPNIFLRDNLTIGLAKQGRSSVLSIIDRFGNTFKENYPADKPGLC